MNAPLSVLEQKLLVQFQHHMPVCAQPYKAMAEQLGCSEQQVLNTLRDLQEHAVLSRVGPVFAHQHAGASTLVALAVSEQRIEHVAAYISSLSAVNHNYRREHAYNLWFVLTGPNQACISQVLEQIQRVTGLQPLNLPMQRAYRIDLGFALELQP